MMTARDWTALAPAVVLAGDVLLLLLVLCVRRSHLTTWLVAVFGIAAAGLSLPAAASVSPEQVTPLLVIDDFAIFFSGVILAAAFGVILLAFGYFQHKEDPPEELYVLVVLATLGAVVLAASDHVAALFLGLETLSLSLYAMIGYLRAGTRSVEAALKYLILGATASAVLLFGAALLYAQGASLRLEAISAAADASPVATAGGLLLFGGLAFKLALVPFHMWTPDVYQGAPAPVTAFIATVSKGAIVALTLRAYVALAPDPSTAFFWVIAAVAAASMIAGNLLALLQKSVKRILAYSSIAHLGYLLVPLLAGGPDGVYAVGYYLAAYVAMTLLAFGVVTAVSSRPAGRRGGSEADADSLDAYRGLMWSRPLLAFALGLSLLSLAGIPATGGFMAKLFVFGAGVRAELWPLVLLVALTSAVGLFYYLRILVATFEGTESGGPIRRIPTAAAIALALAAVATVWLGLAPASMRPLLEGGAAAILSGP